MKKLMPLIVAMSILGCAQTKESPKKMFSVEQTETCFNVGTKLGTYYKMLSDGLPVNDVSSLFESKKIEGDFTNTTIEQISEIVTMKMRTETVIGYYQSKCLNQLIGVPTPDFSSVKQKLKACERKLVGNDLMMCATRETAMQALGK